MIVVKLGANIRLSESECVQFVPSEIVFDYSPIETSGAISVPALAPKQLENFNKTAGGGLITFPHIWERDEPETKVVILRGEPRK